MSVRRSGWNIGASNTRPGARNSVCVPVEDVGLQQRVGQWNDGGQPAFEIARQRPGEDDREQDVAGKDGEAAPVSIARDQGLDSGARPGLTWRMSSSVYTTPPLLPTVMM